MVFFQESQHSAIKKIINIQFFGVKSNQIQVKSRMIILIENLLSKANGNRVMNL
jgi:hypothetical protein